MTRSNIRRMVAAIFVAVIVAVVWNVGKRPSLESVLDIANFTPDDLPELLQRIRNFHRVVTRNGVTVLEVSADEASYFKNDRAVVIVAPRIILYDKGEKVGIVSGNEGRLYMDGNDFTSVELSGDVLFKLAEVRLEAGKLSYDRKKGIVSAPGRALLTAPDMSLSGSGLTVDLASRKLTIAADVKMELRGAAG